MKQASRLLAVFLIMAMAVSMVSGCGGHETDPSSSDISGDSQSSNSQGNADPTGGAPDGSDTVGTTASGAVGTTVPGATDGKNPGGKPQPGTKPVTPGGGGSSSGGNGGNSSKDIVIWGNRNDITLVSAVSEFKKKYPGIGIKISNPPMNSTVSSIKQAIMSNTGPDVLMMDHVYITSLGTEGVFADLRPYGADKVKSKFTPSCWEANSVNGKVYGLPWSANVINFMYNKEMMGNAGAKVPTTYDELVAAGEKIKAKGKIPYTLPIGGPGSNKNWSAFNYFFWLWREGGDILKPDGNGRMRAAFNGPEGVAALQKIVDLKKKGIISAEYKENSFGSQVAMLDMGTWKIDLITGGNKENGLTMMPVLKKGIPPYSGLGLFSYAVSAKSKNPQAAYNFIEILTTNPKYQIKYNGEKFITPLIAAQNDKVYTQGKDKDAWKVFFQQLAVSKFRPGIPGWSDIEKSVSDAVYAAVMGTKNPKDALDAAANVVNKRLDRLYK